MARPRKHRRGEGREGGPLANATEQARSVIANVIVPPPPPDLNRWAEENIVFGNESPIPGPYRISSAPPAYRILECLGPEHPARVVTLMGSAQVFKTTVGQIFVSGMMDLDPSDMLYVHPTHDNAIRWSRTKWRQMRQQSPVLQEILGGESSKSRDATDTLLYQERIDGRGSIQISGANSPASLSMITVPRQVQDDLSKWEMNPAGDPERQADNRSAAFDWAKILKISTPMLSKTCRIARAFREGTQEYWHVPCPHCGFKQKLTWENFQANIDPQKPEDAHFTCVDCGSIMEHKDKKKMIAGGEWVAENPKASNPSFHVWRAYSPTRDWESIARQWLSDQGSPHSEQTFYNDVLGLPYEAAYEAPPWDEIMARSTEYERGTVPEEGKLLCAGVDCQGDRVEIHVKAFGSLGRSWTVDYDIIPHHIGTEECRTELNEILAKRTWTREDGAEMALNMLAIDGGAYTQQVFEWAKPHSWNRVIVVRGAKSEVAPPIALTSTERRPDGKVRKAQRRFYNVGVFQMKAILYEDLKKVRSDTRGYCGYPSGMTPEFFMQLTAERKQLERDKNGYPVARWVLNYDRNEVLDTDLYARAAATRLGWMTRRDEDWGSVLPSNIQEKARPAFVNHSPASRSSLAELSARLNRR